MCDTVGVLEDVSVDRFCCIRVIITGSCAGLRRIWCHQIGDRRRSEMNRMVLVNFLPVTSDTRKQNDGQMWANGQTAYSLIVTFPAYYVYVP